MMPPVGPELPPRLAKRKRSIDEDEDPKSPPQKVLAATAPQAVGLIPPPSKNPDELDVNDSSDEVSYGPSLGPSKPATKAANPAPTKRVLGPAPTAARNPGELEVEDSSGDDYDSSASKPASTAPPPRKRILGPAPPPAPLSELPSQPATSSPDSSDSEDDYGPSLPPAPGSAAETTYLLQRQAEESALAASSSSEPAKPQRAEWMIVPPSDSDWTSRVDPTKLKNRKFASGKGAKAPAEKSGISAIWTETPEQKRQRLADEVLGRSEASLNSSSSSSSRPKGYDKNDEETERRIREYNERNRGKSLYEERKEAQERGRMEKEEEDDPNKRGFDREKDIALGGRMGHVKKKELLSRAADFGSRFQRGKYL